MFTTMRFLVSAVILHSCAVAVSHSETCVQLFEWSWSDIANECETFLGPKGFSSVQISPPMDHITGSQWWTRYQPVTYDLVSRSGNETQFVDMVNRCEASGVSITLDAVINHMAAGSGRSVGGKSYGSRSYPYFSPNDFHHYDGNVNANCEVSNYSDKYNVQYCDLVGLPDLMTSSSYVQEQIAGYINKAYSLGVKGIRIDAAKHQDANELGGITSRLPSDMYINQEVISGQGEAVSPSMYYSLGHVTEFNYATSLAPNIQNENRMTGLNDLGEAWGLMPEKYAVVFLDNHDTQRGGAPLTYKNGGTYNFAAVFMMAYPYGHVRLMSSYYFTDTDMGPPGVGVKNGANCNDGKNWVCEHRWGNIANMVRWRLAAGSSPVDKWQTGSNNQIAFSRNGAAFIAMNRDPSQVWRTTLSTGLPAGSYCNILSSINGDDTATCPTVQVDGAGMVTLEVPNYGAVAFHINAKK